MRKKLGTFLLAAMITTGASAAPDITTCQGCHAPPFGPPLEGVVGRKIAAVPTVDYCAALKAKSSDSWTEANLRAFLMNAQGFAPGCSMNVKMTPEAADAMIVYLKTLR
jgi:cytochrome c